MSTIWQGHRKRLENIVQGRLIRFFNLKSALKQDMLITFRSIKVCSKRRELSGPHAARTVSSSGATTALNC